MAETRTDPNLANSVETLAKAVEKLIGRLDAGIPVAPQPSPQALEAARRFRDVLRGLRLRLPLELAAEAKSASEIALTWAVDEPDIKPAKLVRCLDAECKKFDLLKELGDKDESYRDTKLSADTVYRYKLTASVAGGEESHAIAEAKTSKS